MQRLGSSFPAFPTKTDANDCDADRRDYDAAIGLRTDKLFRKYWFQGVNIGPYVFMEISVKGKNMDVGDALSTHVQDHLTLAVTKYFTQAIDANVTFSREAHQLRVDISVHPGPRGLVIQSKSEGSDAYGAFEGALERIAKQLRRYKRRLSDHHKGASAQQEFLQAQQYVIEPEHEDMEIEPEGQPTIIAEMETHIATLTVSEAVMRMDLADAPVVMFRNGATGGLNVVYKRTDGNIGWIDPSNIE